MQFLSTLSLRRATQTLRLFPELQAFLSTLSLRRATALRDCISCTITISIHALLAESDQFRAIAGGLKLLFLSTLSLRRATHRQRHKHWTELFLSTLSLRRATLPKKRHCPTSCYFYPRSPCGERQVRLRAKAGSLPPISIHALLAESDTTGLFAAIKIEISIHALLAESDPRFRVTLVFVLAISIHALLAESDAGVPAFLCCHFYFYPRSPCGERRRLTRIAFPAVRFLSTLSLRRATKLL